MLITALISIAERVGANRIFKAEGRFHHPFGEPTLSPVAERAWRLHCLRAAVQMLTQTIDKPAVRDLTGLEERC
ncbi:MAG: hypothetical protein HYZ81_01530 [Nitrospinae bacterium]|nr:hypothetical protein [Nitrospinota bacterium]